MVCTMRQSETTYSAAVTLSRGTVEIFTRMLFVGYKTLTMLSFVVKNTQSCKNTKEVVGKKSHKP